MAMGTTVAAPCVINYASLVKSFAADFCGVKTLREATREQVKNFVMHLADYAEKNRDALLCQLNSYVIKKEGVA